MLASLDPLYGSNFQNFDFQTISNFYPIYLKHAVLITSCKCSSKDHLAGDDTTIPIDYSTKT